MTLLRSIFASIVFVSFAASEPSKKVLPLDGEWKVFVSSPEQNGGWNTIWTFTLSDNAKLTVVDLVTSGDRYKVFNGSALLGETSQGPTNDTGGPVLGIITLEPILAFEDPDFERATFSLGPGSYSISGHTSIVGGPGANRAAIRLHR